MAARALPADAGGGGGPGAAGEPSLELAEGHGPAGDGWPVVGVVLGEHLHPGFLNTAVETGEVERIEATGGDKVGESWAGEVVDLPTGAQEGQNDVFTPPKRSTRRR